MVNDLSDEHGGPDAAGAVPHDFSSNGNGCGPCPIALKALQSVDASRYPDPRSIRLRVRLAAFHGVDSARIVIAASASEFIHRITAAVAQGGGRCVALPEHSYGDYARAARGWSFDIVREPSDWSVVDLAWSCDPSSPLGQTPTGLPALLDAMEARRAPVVVDFAYAPLRLTGDPALTEAQRDRVWQLWTPNKALGCTGIRAAYGIAPKVGAQRLRERVDALAPSWPLGAHGAALLDCWTHADTQAWLAESRHTLKVWKTVQRELLQDATDWRLLPSDTNFFCVEPLVPLTPLLTRLRAAGVKLRDCTSFGLPGYLRMAVLPPASLQALLSAI